MNYFRMKLSAAGAGDQTQALQLVKQGGGDGIQISDGLCLKTELGQGELSRLLQDKGMPANLTPVTGATPDLSADEKSFLA
jgi:hypothetical protein